MKASKFRRLALLLSGFVFVHILVTRNPEGRVILPAPRLIVLPSICKAYWTKPGPSVTDFANGTVALQTDHPTFPLVMRVIGVVEGDGTISQTLPHRSIVFLITNLLAVLAKQFRKGLADAARAVEDEDPTAQALCRFCCCCC